MLSEGQICLYVKKCPQYRNRDCSKLERFWECGDYADFKSESSENPDKIINYIVEKLSKIDEFEKKSEKIFEKCPYNCSLIFENPCIITRLSNECNMFECEDCHLYIPDYGMYCETVEYKKCKSYVDITTLKEAYESIGVHSADELKERFGEDNYKWLGGYIRCAFMES